MMKDSRCSFGHSPFAWLCFRAYGMSSAFRVKVLGVGFTIVGLETVTGTSYVTTNTPAYNGATLSEHCYSQQYGFGKLQA